MHAYTLDVDMSLVSGFAKIEIAAIIFPPAITGHGGSFPRAGGGPGGCEDVPVPYGRDKGSEGRHLPVCDRQGSHSRQVGGWSLRLPAPPTFCTKGIMVWNPINLAHTYIHMLVTAFMKVWARETPAVQYVCVQHHFHNILKRLPPFLPPSFTPSLPPSQTNNNLQFSSDISAVYW